MTGIFTGVPRAAPHQPTSKPRVVGAALLALGVAFAGGAATQTAWDGRDVLGMTHTESIRFLGAESADPELRRAAASRAFTLAGEAVKCLRAVADDPGGVGDSARVYLGHLREEMDR